MDREKAEDAVDALADTFLPESAECRFDRVSSLYSKMKIDPSTDRFGTFTFGIVPEKTRIGAVPQNERDYKLSIYVHRPSGHPTKTQFEKLLADKLAEIGLGLDHDDVVTKSLPLLEGFLDRPDKDLRIPLKSASFTLSPGVAIAVSKSSNGALGFFARDENGKTVAVSAAHVLTKDAELQPPSDVMQPDASGRVIGNSIALPAAYQHWYSAGDVMTFSVNAGENTAPDLLQGLKTKLKQPRTDYDEYGSIVAKLGPGNGFQHGLRLKQKSVAILHSRRSGGPKWRVSGVTLVQGLSNRAFAANSDSGAPVFDESGYLYGIVLGGSRSSQREAADTVVLPASRIANALSLRIEW